MRMTDTILQFGGYYLEYGKAVDRLSLVTNFSCETMIMTPSPMKVDMFYIIRQTRGMQRLAHPCKLQVVQMECNEKGLSMGYNLINRMSSDTGFICNMIGRILLETCANVEEAISLLKEIPHRRSFSYVLLDQTGKSIVVEASPREVIIHQSNICTNHFEVLTHENRYQIDGFSPKIPGYEGP